ncbi:Insect cuticle protein [Popillia japonica]|uniref:Insect cuticle protein n=1 Tax=Popillia japonica TaxID=7064 RepID=A0AAW1LBU1_POPJA
MRKSITKIIVYCVVCVLHVSGLKSGGELPPNAPVSVSRGDFTRRYDVEKPLTTFRPYPGAMPSVDGIIRQSSQSNPDESYEYSFETANGIQVEERGIRSSLQDSPIISSGTFEYTAPDNTPIVVKYVANENGFQAEGVHLPTPPPIPFQIIRALEWNAAHPEPNT